MSASPTQEAFGRPNLRNATQSGAPRDNDSVARPQAQPQSGGTDVGRSSEHGTEVGQTRPGGSQPARARQGADAPRAARPGGSQPARAKS